ncbi:hypothetical protein pb186bvf_005619 [Paramecium bursaria]
MSFYSFIDQQNGKDIEKRYYNGKNEHPRFNRTQEIKSNIAKYLIDDNFKITIIINIKQLYVIQDEQMLASIYFIIIKLKISSGFSLIFNSFYRFIQLFYRVIQKALLF